MTDTTMQTSGEKWERLAFAYCKIATISLLFGRFALPFAATLSGTFFLIAWLKGKRDTRCYLQNPLLVAALWLLVLAFWLAAEFLPRRVPFWINWIHR